MTQSVHCALCQHEIRTLKEGLVCSLTGKKPDFKNFCKNILLEEKFKMTLEYTNLKMNLMLKKRRKNYLIFLMLVLIGILFIIGNKFYAEFLDGTIRYWEYRIICIGVGISILILAFFKLTRFQSHFNSIKLKKKMIDAALKNYGITYKMVFDFKPVIHGDQEIQITTNYKNWSQKQTTTTVTLTNALEFKN